MREVIRRLLHLLLVLVLVTMFSALLLSLLPGDPAEAIAPFASPEQRAALREDLGLDEPLYVRYLAWLQRFVRGDLGEYYSVSSSRPVADDIAQALPVSLQLMLYAQVLALAVALPLGVFTAYRAGSRLDRAASATVFAMLAVPGFALGLILSFYVGTKYRFLDIPPGGYTSLADDPADHFRRMTLPAVTLAAGQVATYVRVLRSEMIGTLQESFITAAAAKGITPRRILWRHALRPSSLSLFTVAGLNVGTLISGAVVIEVVFSLPGMGLLTTQAIASRQYVALQSLVAIFAIAYVLINFAVDVTHSLLDPRIRHAEATHG